MQVLTDPAGAICPIGWPRYRPLIISDIDYFLEGGMLPDGDFRGSAMGPVIEDDTSHLTREDCREIAVYLKSVPPQQYSAGRNSGVVIIVRALSWGCRPTAPRSYRKFVST